MKIQTTKTKHIKIAFPLVLLSTLASLSHASSYCSGYDKVQKTSIYGDALSDSPDCLDRDGKAYPSHELKRMLPQLNKLYQGNNRQGRTMFGQKNHVQDPNLTTQELLNYHKLANEGRIEDITAHIRQKRQAGKEDNSTEGSAEMTTMEPGEDKRPPACVNVDQITPARLCKSTFNTTAPMYGVSLTSGEPVTIVQIFPDLLQQVVYEMCDAKECDILHGECVQTYVPYLFLVIPLGPVTLTGQDYVLVESGCSCRPKYARPGSDPNPASVIPSF